MWPLIGSTTRRPRRVLQPRTSDQGAILTRRYAQLMFVYCPHLLLVTIMNRVYVSGPNSRDAKLEPTQARPCIHASKPGRPCIRRRRRSPHPSHQKPLRALHVLATWRSPSIALGSRGEPERWTVSEACEQRETMDADATAHGCKIGHCGDGWKARKSIVIPRLISQHYTWPGCTLRRRTTGES